MPIAAETIGRIALQKNVNHRLPILNMTYEATLGRGESQSLTSQGGGLFFWTSKSGCPTARVFREVELFRLGVHSFVHECRVKRPGGCARQLSAVRHPAFRNPRNVGHPCFGCYQR